MSMQECKKVLESEFGAAVDIVHVKTFDGGFLFAAKSTAQNMFSGGTYVAVNSTTGKKGYSVIEEDAIKFCLA